ncbi:MAG: hypothetical protein ACJZ4M_01345 [Candidatus Thalassarchaeaceae archaeon]|nr:MAG: hypothetical protein CND66_00255 [Marine Group II euryarchaeote MED-G37]|tara:strand:+ start:101 stop:328 length:228 start_codon:yes stop_codon:yes gene_type:complete
MADAGSVATLTLLGACGFVVLIVLNLVFFLNQEESFSVWLKNATSKQRFLAVLDGLVTIFMGLQFLDILFLLILI